MALVFFLQFCWSISLQTEQPLNLLMRVVRKDPMGWDNAVLRGELIGARVTAPQTSYSLDHCKIFSFRARAHGVENLDFIRVHH